MKVTSADTIAVVIIYAPDFSRNFNESSESFSLIIFNICKVNRKFIIAAKTLTDQ